MGFARLSFGRGLTADRPLGSIPGLRPALESQIQRASSQHRQHRERTPTWPVHGGKRGVLTGLQNDVNRPPEQGIVRAETMRAWRDLSRGGLSVMQDREALAVQIHIDLPKPDVVR